MAWNHPILTRKRKHGGGTAICFRDKNTTANNIITDKNGKYQILDVELNGHKITLTNVYAPSRGQYKIQKDRKSLWTTLHNILTDRSTPDSIHILAGDFNMTEDKQDRTTLNEYQQTCLSQTSLTALKNTLNIEEVYRKQHPSAKQYTYFHHRTMTRTRLDRIYTSKSIDHHITNAALIPTTMSDHYNAPQTTITFDKITRGKGVWIFNNNLLQDNEYVKLITETLADQTNAKRLYRDIADWWENTKQTIKQKTAKYAKAKTKQEKKYETYLRKRLRNTLRKEERLRRDNRISQQLRAKIEEIEKKKEQGARIRTKIEWNNDGERNTKLFFALEKQKTASRSITQLKDENGTVKDKQEDILNIIRNFYKTLYKNEFLDEKRQDEILKNTKLPKLLNDLKNKCDIDLTETEITKALNNTKNGKSPGSDGLSPDFYKKFWGQLSRDFTEMTNAVLNRKLLTPTQRQALLTCIYKNGDRKDIANWRPISLFNTDYKLITKTLTNRFKQTLPHIISKHQTACVPNRQLHMNLLYTRDILKIAKTEQYKDTCVVSIDQVKAFDRVCWSYLTKVLHKYNYGTKTIENIKTLYTDIETSIKANGHLTAPFHPTRGVRQGCPLSMILYILQADVMIRNVEQDKNIKGITVNKDETKVTAYADDTLFYITGKESLLRLDQLLEDFENATGTKLNRNKCRGVWIGKDSHRMTGPLNFNWKETHLKTLGVLFDREGQDQLQPNWTPILQKIEKTIHAWKRHNLSLKGRVLVLNSLVMSKIWHTAQVIPLPEQETLSKLNSTLQDYLWDNKKTKINRKQLQQTTKDGGLNLTDIQTKFDALQARWATKLLTNTDNAPWTHTAKYYLDKYRDGQQGKLTFLTYISTTGLKALPKIYQHMLNAWSELTVNKTVRPDTLEGILNQPLFYNTNMKIKHTPTNPFPPLPKPNTETKKSDITILADICRVFAQGFLTAAQLNISDKTLNEITNRIPTDWKEKINNSTQNYPHQHYRNEILMKGKPIQLIDITTRQIYNSLLTNRTKTEHRYLRWTNGSLSETLPIDKKTWEQKFLNLKKRNKYNKATDIIYKYIHRKLPSLDRINKWIRTISNTCKRCATNTETPEHWFYACRDTQALCHKTITILNKTYPDETFQNNLRFFLLGFEDNDHGIGETILETFYETLQYVRNKLTITNEKTDSLKHFTTLLTKRLYIEKSLTADKTGTKQYIDAIAECKSNLI